MPATAPEIVAIVVKETGLPAESLRPEATLAELQIESIDMVSVIFAIEDRWGVSISNEEAAEAATFGDFVAMVSAKTAATG